jgi:DNA-binding transcriptional LysR family regulator
MKRDALGDLEAFLAIARERSFTLAAAGLGVSTSALSHTMRRLEERLGVRLLTRTTRSVSVTEAGEQLALRLGPHLDGINAELEGLGEFREKPAGTLRITTSAHAAVTILVPALETLLPTVPGLSVELNVDAGFVDIVAERFDAGVRLGETVAQDMIAVRIGPDMSMAAAASPAYFARRGQPKTPRDLAGHSCINLRFPTHGGVYVWEFEKAGRPLNVRVEGQLTVNDTNAALRAAVGGLGITYLPDDMVEPHIRSGELVRVLANWCPPFPGFHLYYPSRRQQSPALAALVEALRYRG